MSRGASLNEIWRERQRMLAPGEARQSEHPHHRGYDPNQPRVPAGHPDSGQWTDKWPGELRRILAEVEDPASALAEEVLRDLRPELPRTWFQYAESGIGHNSARPDVEVVQEILHAALRNVNASVHASIGNDPISPRLYGVLVHVAFAKVVRGLNIPGIGEKGVEQSFDLEGLARYGLDGSIRTDVVLRDRGERIIAIFDVKTGNATMSESREAKIRRYTKVGPHVPIIILHARRPTHGQ